MGVNDMGLKTKIFLGSGVTLVLLVVLGLVSWSSMGSLLKSSHWVDHTHTVIQEAMKIEAAAVDMETGMRGYLLAGKEEFLEPYNAGKERFEKLTAALQNTVNDNPEQVKLLDETRNTIGRWVEKVVEPTIALRRRIGDAETMNDLAGIVGEARGKAYFDKLRGQIATFVDREAKLLTERQEAAEKATAQNETLAKTMEEAAHWVDHTQRTIAAANEILAAAVDMETGMRGYLLAGKEEFLEPYNAGQKRFGALVAALSQTVNDNPAQVRLLGEIEETRNGWQQNVTEPAISFRKEVGAANTMDDVAVLVGEARGKVYVDKLRRQVETFIDREAKLLDQRQAASAKAAADAKEMRKIITTTAVWVAHTNKVMATANEILAAAVDMETGVRGYLLAGKEGFLDPYNAGREKFGTLIASLSKTVDDNPAQVKLLGEAKTTVDEWQNKVIESQIALRRTIGDAQTMDDMADLVGEARGKVYFDKFREQIKTFKEREGALMTQRQAAAQATADRSNYIIVGGITFAVVLAVLIALLLARSVMRPFRNIFQGLKTFSKTELAGVGAQFREVIDGLGGGASNVAAASEQIAAGSSEQAANIEETSSSLEEMASMTKQNADNAGQADTLMKGANQVVTDANTSMMELTESMDEISKASEETSKIIKTIDEIAFQTNLLALNAAVEAARAGEAGAGFAVVADEVRNLAMRAAEAAKNTSDLIEDTVKKVGDGSNLVSKTNEAFVKVAESTSKVGELVGEIAAASNEQSQGIEQVNTAVAEMDKVVQANAAGSEELSSQAEEVNNMVGVLLEIVEGNKGSGQTRDDNSLAEASNNPTYEQKHSSHQTVRDNELVESKSKQTDPKRLIPMDDEDFADF